jgi:hypothetical protein
MAAVFLLVAVGLAAWVGVAGAGAAVLGVLGWLVALAGRLPVVGAAGRLRDLRRGGVILAVTSGVTDEVVRLVFLPIGGTGFASVLWAGFGWAVADLVATGGFAGAHGVRGVVRGIAMTAFHLGATTVLLAVGPWWLLLTVPVHVAANLVVARTTGAGGTGRRDPGGGPVDRLRPQATAVPGKS